MKTRALPPVEYLRESLKYDAEVGILTWKSRPRLRFKTERDWRAWNTRYAGKTAGVLLERGYYGLRICGVRYLLHRVIWKFVTGDEPLETIDHVDLDPSNNRWSNLRTATFTEQQYNSPLQKNNTSGVRGVSLRPWGKWRAEIWEGGRNRYLGMFDTKDAAAATYKEVARELHGEFYRES